MYERSKAQPERVPAEASLFAVDLVR
jgi:hypothetical protein